MEAAGVHIMQPVVPVSLECATTSGEDEGYPVKVNFETAWLRSDSHSWCIIRRSCDAVAVIPKLFTQNTLLGRMARTPGSGGTSRCPWRVIRQVRGSHFFLSVLRSFLEFRSLLGRHRRVCRHRLPGLARQGYYSSQFWGNYRLFPLPLTLSHLTFFNLG